ncbi:hypothetical protein KJA15_04040 [Patescibacteria group bacterium]|nr:hypothetical protein [Patescibacteria group bacterium]
MSKISKKRRQFKIKRGKKKRKKIRKLKEKYFTTQSKEGKGKIIEKMRKISPHSPIEETLSVKKENKVE